MAKYRANPKDILEKKLSTENPRLNYNRLYAAAVLAAFDAQESLEALNIGACSVRGRVGCGAGAGFV